MAASNIPTTSALVFSVIFGRETPMKNANMDSPMRAGAITDANRGTISRKNPHDSAGNEISQEHLLGSDKYKAVIAPKSKIYSTARGIADRYVANQFSKAETPAAIHTVTRALSREQGESERARMIEHGTNSTPDIAPSNRATAIEDGTKPSIIK